MWLAAGLTTLILVASACGSDDGAGGEEASGGEAELSAELAASGATFPKAFYEEAIAEFKAVQPGVTMAYGGGGSGKGRQDLADQLVDWAGTDGLVKDEDKAKFKGGEFLYFPTVAAPITVSYNVDGVDELQLSADAIAKIFQRQITTWSDPAIAADNPDADLPSTPIVVARRSDGSGTTENFTKFLVAAAPSTWTLKSGSTVEWPADTQAGNGNAGVASIVKGTSGAIGYVDLSDAIATDLAMAKIKNKAGKWVEPTLEGTSAALEGAEIKPDLSYNPLWADGDEAYPIAAPTWIIAYKNQTDRAKGQAVRSWLNYLLTDGQELAPEIDFAPLPDELKDQALAQLDKLVVPA
jgi:phosphate transport system substrate-binding protein